MKLVIGYGNPLRGDDGVGWRVAEALPDGAAEVMTVHQLTPELADPISRAAVVVFVDAAAEGEPGHVACLALGAPGESINPYAGSHLTTPGDLLQMAESLFGRRPPAYMVTITGASFELSEGLTPAVEAAVPQAVAAILYIGL